MSCLRNAAARKRFCSVLSRKYVSNEFSKQDTGMSGATLHPYSGTSMAGTFQHGDLLEVDRVPFRLICPGDVVVFLKHSVADQNYIVHRVRHATSHGMITRGDNSPRDDVLPVTAGRFVGRVTGAIRQGKRRRISNGWRGMLHANHHRALCNARRRMSWILCPVYITLGTCLARWLRWQPRIHRIKISTPSSSILLKFVHAGRTVACWNQEDDTWVCRKPYDLILNRPRS